MSETEQTGIDLGSAKTEAEALCMAIYRRKYKTTSPDFELCDSIAGVISQIDNMIGGLFDENASLKAELAKHQESEFHPDWSLLEATRAVVKEQAAEILKLNEKLDKHR
jgi:hypothetical protein